MQHVSKTQTMCKTDLKQCVKPVNQAWKCANEISEPLLPPRVAEMRMWVPYFLMMVSMNC